MDAIINFFSALFNMIPKIVYFLGTCIMTVVDLLQLLFRKLAGLDTVIIGNDVYSGDIVSDLIVSMIFGGKYPVLNYAFWSFIILGVILLFLSTLIGIFRTEYTPDKDTKNNSKSGVMKNALKGLFAFVIIPIATVFGLFIGNTVLSAVDSATSYSGVDESYADTGFVKWTAEDANGDLNSNIPKNGSYTAFAFFGVYIPTSYTPFSGIVFRSSCYSANRARSDNTFYSNLLKPDEENSEVSLNFGVFNKQTGQEANASIIDDAFSLNLKLQNPKKLDTSYVTDLISLDFFAPDLAFKVDCFNKYRVDLVWTYYNLWTFNYIILFLAIIILLKLFMSITFNMFARIFECLGYMIMAPVVCGIMPLDSGAALTRWRQKFLAKIILAYSFVFAMNILYMILPVFMSIKFFNIGAVDYIIQTLLVIAGVLSVQGISSGMSKILIDKDAEDVGNEGLAGKASSTLRTSGRAAWGAAKMGAALTPIGLASGAVALRANVLNKRQEKDSARASREERLGAEAKKQLSDFDKQPKEIVPLRQEILDSQIAKEKSAADKVKSGHISSAAREERIVASQERKLERYKKAMASDTDITKRGEYQASIKKTTDSIDSHREKMNSYMRDAEDSTFNEDKARSRIIKENEERQQRDYEAQRSRLSDTVRTHEDNASVYRNAANEANINDPSRKFRRAVYNGNKEYRSKMGNGTQELFGNIVKGVSFKEPPKK